MALNELEQALVDACRIALRAIEYEGDDRTAFRGAAFDALTKAMAKAEEKRDTHLVTSVTAQFGNNQPGT